jgi:SAM-dependent methyltransferase
MSTISKTISCFCGNNEDVITKTIPYTDLRFKNKFSEAFILKCKHCGLLRTSPTPILDMPEIYSEDSVSDSHMKNIPLWETFSQEIIDKLIPYKSSGKLLDIGCNIGILVKMAKEAGFDASGIDLNNEAINFGVKKFNLALTNQRLEDIPGENIYDVITMNHVIEHIADLQSFTNHIRRLLKKDGIFLSVCPNAESGIVKTLNLLNKKKSGKGANWFWYGYLPEQHVWQFGPRSLDRVLTKCGFGVIRVSAHQNMHWGITNTLNFRFQLMNLLWSFFARIGSGDNLFVWCRPNK